MTKRRNRRHTPRTVRQRIWDLAGTFADHAHGTVAEYAPAAVLFDLLHAPTRRPVDICEHQPATDGTTVAMFDATNRTVRCPRCAVGAVLAVTRDEETVMNQDVWCDICDADTSTRPPTDGGGNACVAYPYGQLQAVIWLCVDCEPFFATVTTFPEPDGSMLRIDFGPPRRIVRTPPESTDTGPTDDSDVSE